MPRLVAVVLNWNRRDDTRACLASLQASTMPMHALVVDNGSTEGDPRELVAGFPEKDAPVTYELVRNDENLGFARGMNSGIDLALAQGADFVWVLNNDVTVAPDAAAALVRALEEDAHAAAAAPLVYDARHAGRLSHAGGRVSLARGRTWHLHEGLARPPHEAPYEADFVEASALMVRADDLRAQGGFDPGYGAYWEDVDWCLTARARGRRVLVVPAARVTHGVSGSSGGVFGPYALYHRARNRFRCARKHGTRAQRVAMPLRALVDLPLECYHARRGSGGWTAPRAWLHGTWDGLRGRWPR